MVQLENIRYLLRTTRRNGRKTEGERKGRREKAGKDN